ncbi:hypothetical protein BDV19DRAFT_384346 [Aspergillus venezuelensis]
MFSGNWLETQKNTVKLEGDDSRFVQTMIDFMYGFTYDTSKHGNMLPMMFHVAAYQIADKYDVTKIKEYTKEKFERLVGIYWDISRLPLQRYIRCFPRANEAFAILLFLSHAFIWTSCFRDSFTKVFNQTPEFAADVVKKLLYEGTRFCEVSGSNVW